ncbi:hypothetical protein KDA00_00735, partial [Candidatus Saccharibacteria bacterium]|nr:hypothetical protein [Candidatus Saccharibacteria bacterium]
MNNDLNHRDSTEIIGHTDIPETSVIKARTSKPQINNDYSDDNSTIKPQKLNIIEKLFIVLLIIVPLSLLQFGSGGFEKIKNKISDLQAETKEPISSTSKPKTDTFSLDDKGMKQYLDNHKLYGLDEDNFELNYGSVYEDEKHSNQHPEIILRYSEKDSKKRVKISQSDSKNDYPIGFINCPGYPEYTNTISAKQFLVSAIDLTKDTCIKIDNSEDYIYIYRKYDGATTTE